MGCLERERELTKGQRIVLKHGEKGMSGVVAMWHSPNGEDFIRVVAMCHYMSEDDFSHVVAKCPPLNGEDF